MRRIALLVPAAGMAIAAAHPMAAGAAAGIPAGYWWVAQPATGVVPAPPQVPAGGLYVASTANGPSAVSAVRLATPSGARLASLVLHVHQVQQLDSFAVDAYATGGSWKPGDAQAWSSRPGPAIGALAIHGAVDANGKTVTFDLTDVKRAVLNLVLVPGVNSGSQTAGVASSPTFDAAFEPVLPADVTVATTAPSDTQQLPTAPAPRQQPVGAQAPPDATGNTGALQPPLPAAGQVQASLPPPATPPVVATIPAAQQPVAAVVPAGRSTRDTILLAFLLADAMIALVLQARRKGSGDRDGRAGLYELP